MMYKAIQFNYVTSLISKLILYQRLGASFIFIACSEVKLLIKEIYHFLLYYSHGAMFSMENVEKQNSTYLIITWV